MANNTYNAVKFEEAIMTYPAVLSQEENKIFEMVKNKLAGMRSEINSVNSVRALSKDFYVGDQWDPADYRSTTMITDNKCQPIVDKYVSFFMGEPPRDVVPVKGDLADLIGGQTARLDQEEMENGLDKETKDAEIRQKIIYTVKNEDNNYRREMMMAAHNAWLLGDAFLRVLYLEDQKKIVIDSLNPKNVVIGWKSDNFKEFDWAAVVSRRSLEAIYNQYGIKVGEEEEYFSFEGKTTDIKMANVIDYWDEDMNVIIIGDHLLKAESHNYGFIPFIHLPCLLRPNEPYGSSPLESVISLQRTRNELWSDLYDMIHYVPNNTIIAEGANIQAKDLPTGSLPKILPIKAGGKVYPLELARPGFEANRLLEENLKAIDDASGMPRIAYGQVEATLATGIGLTTAFQPAIQRMKMVANNWEPGIQKLNEYILRLAEKYFGAKQFIEGKYYTVIKWGKFSPRDFSIHATNVINLKNANIYSTRKAMEEMEVENPREEMIEIAVEKNNEYLNPELAMQRMQIINQIEAMKAQKEQSQAGAPALGPEMNQFGPPQPMAQRGAGAGAPPRNAPTPVPVGGI